jgi:alanyl aminopeptidase
MRIPALLVVGPALAAVACSAPQTAPTPASHVAISPPADAAPMPPALSPPQPTLRLPRNFTPTGYTAHLAIDPRKPTFDGSIQIAGTVSEASSVIWLHGRHLTIHAASAEPVNAYGVPKAPRLTVTPRGDDLLEIHADPPLAAGAWVLSFDYTGEIDSVNTTGAFVEKSGGEPYVFSQFEAVYARRVFPCLDEPDSKVPWQLTLDVPAGDLAVSNTNVEEDMPLSDGSHRFVFHRTKPLPSYLVAFGVGPLEIVDAGKTQSGVPVRIITLKGRTADAAYPAQTAAKIIDALEDWFGMPYPYEKVDLMSIPLTVGFGAMENAGLVTLTERIILLGPQPSWERRHGWMLTASHELAHQWFGDLVTTSWWDDLWLNEGFATWMESKIAAKVEPSWHDERDRLGTRLGALAADSVVSARRIRQPIASPGDILNAFDGITYDKGASVMNMFEAYVGPAVFQQGVRAYLHAKAFGNATSADFEAAISQAAGKDLAPAFSTFLDQAGAPEIAAKLVCDKGGAHVELAQKRYLPPGSATPPEQKPWIVPVCVAYDRSGKRAEACTMLDGPTGALALDTKTCPRWLMSNVEGHGYYRSRYTAADVTALRDRAWPQLSWTERRAVFDDIADAARTRGHGSGLSSQPPVLEVPLPLAMSFVPKLLAGADRFTVSDALALPLGLDRFVPDAQRGAYEAWLRRTFGPLAARLGMLPRSGDDLDSESMRAAVFSAVAWTGRDRGLIKQAVAAATKGWHDLPAGIRGTVLRIAVDASPELFTKILTDVRGEPDRAHRREMYDALASVRDPARLQQALQLLLDPSLDFRETMALMYSPSTPATRALVQTFFKDHQAALLARMPQDEVSGGLVGLTWLFTGTCDPTQRDALASYVRSTFGSMPGGARVVAQAIEAMDQCIATRTSIGDGLKLLQFRSGTSRNR